MIAVMAQNRWMINQINQEKFAQRNKTINLYKVANAKVPAALKISLLPAILNLGWSRCQVINRVLSESKKYLIIKISK